MDSHYSHFLVSCVKLTLITLYSLHVSACVFFLLARLHSFDAHTVGGRGEELQCLRTTCTSSEQCASYRILPPPLVWHARGQGDC